MTARKAKRLYGKGNRISGFADVLQYSAFVGGLLRELQHHLQFTASALWSLCERDCAAA
jgi:hypothetical protein